MKILKIKIKNINCLRCEWEINFQSPPLSHAGLFAITGPTGSGKSTILDAITLALFNKIPRFESDTITKNFIEKSGSIITRSETDSFVEVAYSCSKGIFCSKWSVAINKRGGLRETDMELIDASTNKPVLSGKKEVPKKNTELIGLTYDQFIKSILLSQGEFARFLKSKKDERGKLLEDITGMTIYRELGKKAFEKFKEKNEVIKSKIDIIESEEEQLLSQEKENELDEFIQAINKEIQKAEANRSAIEKAIDVKNQIQSIDDEIEKNAKEEEQINKELEDFNKVNAERMLNHNRLLPYLNEIRNYHANYDSIQNIKEEIKKKEPELEDKRKAVNGTLSSISEFIGLEVESHNALKALTDFGIKVSHHITNRLNAEKALSLQKIKISNLLKKAALVRYKNFEASNKIDELKEKLSKEISSIISFKEQLVNQTKIKTENIDKQKESLSARLQTMKDLKNQVENFAENQKKINAKEQQIKEASAFINNNQPILKDITISINSVNIKINEVKEKREKKLREKNLEDDRELLKQGEPCPLCGSLHHPYVHEYFNNVSELTKKLQDLEIEVSQFETKKQELQNEISTHTGTLNVLKKEMSDIEKEMTIQKNKISDHKERLKIVKIGNVHTIELTIAELEESIEAISKFEKLDSDKRELENFKEDVDELALSINEFAKAKQEVELRYNGSNISDDCDLLRNQLTKLNDDIQSMEATLNANKNRLEELANHQTKIEATVNHIFKSFGYPDILSSFKDVLPDAEFNNLTQQLSNLNGNIKRINALTLSANERKQQLLSDDATKSKEQLLEELDSTLQQLEKDKQNLDEHRAQKMQNESRKNRITRLKQQVDETRQANLKWELLSKYIGDALGKNFSTFAQGLTLKKLIQLTNVRLQKLNDRYFLDMPLEDEDDDLVIIDTYLGEERRSVKTLSGGETFIVSLALALALSDLASRNVKIESLYIDEGFGSLDPEALDMAISTLEQLQVESNKTIGIISHVDSLKERIETQIQLEKNSNGFSKIVIK